MSLLHKSFKPAKCKTALKLAATRIKLLKNKRDAQLKQLKREVAQLLEAGQDQIARIRVEHVVREEKTMAAYVLVEIYCELIVARLPIIESQKNCPIDLKEAISSVIFASPRCVDIPELMDVQKHFTAKYGKDFVSAAVELRPDCGVSRLLVEKLAARAPDGPTKIKILSAIAEEHNVKWDPNSFEEKVMQPPQDLLNGPSMFEQASRMHAAPYNVQKPANDADTGSPNFQAPPEYNERHDASTRSYGPYSRSSNTQNFPPTDFGANMAMPSNSSHSALRPQGTGDAQMESYSYAGHGNGLSLGRQNWTMEFKDATAAAQAAAESAERASMAARAAAELSSQGRMTRQHSAESPKTSASWSREEDFQRHADSKLQGENVVKNPTNIIYNKMNSGMHHLQTAGNEEDSLAGLAERFYSLKSSSKTSQSASSKSIRDFVDDYPPVNDVETADKHSQNSSHGSDKKNFLGETNVRTESSESEEEPLHKVQDGKKYENLGYFEEVSMRKQSSNVSSHSHSRNFSDNYNVVSHFNYDKSNEEAVEDPFIIGEGKTQRKAKESNSYNNATAVFDDSGSDDDEFKFDEEGRHGGGGSTSYFWSEGRRQSSNLLADTNSWSPRQNTGESLGKSSSKSLFASEQHSNTVFSEVLKHDVVPPETDELLPVTFDGSDGPSSESEGELGKSKVVQGTSTGIFPHKEDIHTRNPETSQNESSPPAGSSLARGENLGLRKTCLQPSALDSAISVETDRSSYGNFHFHQASPRHVQSQSHSNDFSDNLRTPEHSSVRDNVQGHQSPYAMEDSEPKEQSSFEIGKELNFGILTGGLKNKGYKHPPYRRNTSSNSSFSKEAAGGTSELSSSSSKVDVTYGAYGPEPYSKMMQPKANVKARSRTVIAHSDCGSNDSDEEHSQHSFSSSKDPYGKKSSTEGNKKPSSMTYFDSDNSDSEEDLPKQTSTNSTYSGSVFSQHTKASPSNSSVRSYSESSDTAIHVTEPKSSLRSSRPTKMQPKPQFQGKSTDYWDGSEKQISATQTSSKPIPQPRRSLHEVTTSRSSHTADSPQKNLTQSKSSDYSGSSEQLRSTGQAASKPIEHKRSSNKERLKSSAREQPSNPSLKSVASMNAETPKASSSHNETPSRENSISKASHVHPKLPDYDVLIAHLLSLRQNRQ